MKRSTMFGIGAAIVIVAVGSAYFLGVDETLRLLEGIIDLIRGE